MSSVPSVRVLPVSPQRTPRPQRNCYHTVVKFLVACLLLSVIALAQTAPKATPPATKSAPQSGQTKGAPGKVTPAPDDGSINGDTYTSDYFGFRYTFPAGMETNEEFMQEHQDAEHRAFVLLALQRPDAQPGYQDMLVIMADRNTSPAMKTAAEYLQQTASTHFQTHGFEVLHAVQAVTIAGRPFARVDYHKGDVNQTVLATMWRGYALVFNIAAPTTEAVDKLVASLDTLKFPVPQKPAAAAKPRTR